MIYSPMPSLVLDEVILAESYFTTRFAIDNYLAISEETGRPAQKPYSSKLMLRVGPEIHAAVASVAQVQGKSINQWASEVLNKAAHL